MGVKTTTLTEIFEVADVPQIYIYTSSSLEATMPCEVTRASDSGSTLSYSFLSFSGSGPKLLTFGYKTISRKD